MADFDFTTLITDRTQADVAAVSALTAKIQAGTATTEEEEQFNAAAMRGAYNYTDLNRVSSAVYYLDNVLQGYGYQTGVQKIVVPHEESGGGGTSRLPEGYTELEYIQSSGTQYIDTGFKPTQDTRVIMDVDLLADTAWVALFGARDAATTKEYSVVTASATAINSRFNASTVSLTVSTVIGRYLIDKNKALCLINDSQLENTSSTFQPSYYLYLFAQNNGGAIWGAAKAKLYFCKVYDNGTLIRDYVPCKNASGETGLYDLVNGTFYANAGTGAFAAGPVVYGLEVAPSEPVEMDDYTWYEPDVPTPTLMAAYLANVVAVYSTLLSEPELPETMQQLTAEGANQIEAALIELDRAIHIMMTTFIPSGEALCGGDNL